MNPQERRATLGLSLIFALRMLGLFMILPVFALYAGELDGVTPLTLGLALGIYGLTQALLQLPFGLASDRLGRKPVIVAGLLIFAAGSVLAALADDILWVIAGRALQGAGAVGAVINALLADLTRETVRTAAMAVLGIGIGACFLLAMVLGPVLHAWISVPGIFWLTAALGLLCIVVLLTWVPQAPPLTLSDEPHSWRELLRVLSSAELLRLDGGIFVLHAILTSLFVAMPLALRDAGLAGPQHWQVYLPVMLLSILLLLPLLQYSGREGGLKPAFLGCVSLLAMALMGLALTPHQIGLLAVLLLLFFAGFNLLEASLPSLVSRCAPAGHRGAALGVYSSLQFLGTFCGGALGGFVLGKAGTTGVFLFAAGLALVWLVFAAGMQVPQAEREIRL
ncbi:MAG TPA: MFS transporter [Nevskiales bacterium]|nr:MFS transporter [Nevskiales bacterium]